MINIREYCYRCNRVKSSCVCKYINTIETKTKFVLIMHPKEYRKTKNNTGKMTINSLSNSKIFVGIDFSQNKEINELIDNEKNSCFVLYPGESSINLNKKNIKSEKDIVIFIIDSTWPCSKKILRLSEKLNSLPKISFSSELVSNYQFKKQPNPHCLSTIESTLCILKLLNFHNIENVSQKNLNEFLNPFNEMVEYQIKRSDTKQIRYK